MLRKPVLAMSNRNSLAAENAICRNQERWFDSIYFRDAGVYSASFDFSVYFPDFFGMLDGQTVYETAESLEEIWKIIDTDSRMIINGNAKAEDEGDDTEYE